MKLENRNETKLFRKMRANVKKIKFTTSKKRHPYMKHI